METLAEQTAKPKLCVTSEKGEDTAERQGAEKRPTEVLLVQGRVAGPALVWSVNAQLCFFRFAVCFDIHWAKSFLPGDVINYGILIKWIPPALGAPTEDCQI